MSEKNLLPAELDPRNPSYDYKNKYNEHVENSDQFNKYLKNYLININKYLYNYLIKIKINK